MHKPMVELKRSRYPAARSFILAALVAFAVLAACNDSSEQTAGIDGSGVRIYVEGPIEGFGSIVLNGNHYEVASAVIRVNGAIATEQDLAIGQVVEIDALVGEQGGAIADSVSFRANLRGPVQSLGADVSTLVVLGQQVRTSAQTNLDIAAGDALSALEAGDIVEVSGLVDADGGIDATHVADAAASAPWLIVGRVDDQEAGALTFSIGSLVVDYGSAGLIEGFPAGGPRDGDEVLVTANRFDASGALVATGLELLEVRLSGREGYEAEVEGLITRFVTPSDFDVAGTRVTATAATDYEGGTEADLQPNVKLQVEGRIDAGGVIVADKIEVKDGGAISAD